MVNSSVARLILTNPIRAASISLSRTPPLYDKFEHLKGLVKLFRPLPSSNWNSFVPKCYRNSYCVISQSKFAWGRVLGASIVIGSISLKPRITYAINGFDILENDRHLGFSDASSADEDQRNLLAITRKLIVPFLLFLTISMNLHHPAILAVKIILILFGTKPSPLSIYIFIEQLRRRYMQEQPILFRFKSLYANKVEVEDYAFMCLARVEIMDQNFTLVGILGNWWVFPRLTPQRSFTLFRDQLMHYIRN